MTSTSKTLQALRIDHFVLTVRDVERSVRFYESALGMKRVTFAGGRVGLAFGEQKINLHQLGKEFEPKAQNAVAGGADFCLIVEASMQQCAAALARAEVDIIHGPVDKIGALGAMKSLYFRDPDGNLVEIARYEKT